MAASLLLSCLIAVLTPSAEIIDTIPTALPRLDHEKPSTVSALVQSITHVRGFHLAKSPYQPSMRSTGKKAELMKIKTNISGKRELTTSCEPVRRATAIKKLPTAIARNEVINISDSALGIPPLSSAPNT